MNRINPMDLDDEDWDELADLAEFEEIEAILARSENEALRTTSSTSAVHRCPNADDMEGQQSNWSRQYADSDDYGSEMSDEENDRDAMTFMNTFTQNPWVQAVEFGREAGRFDDITFTFGAAITANNINAHGDDDEENDLDGFDYDDDEDGPFPLGMNSMRLSIRPCNNCMINQAFPNGIFSIPLDPEELALHQTVLAEPGEDVVPMAAYVKETDELIAQMLAKINGGEPKIKTD